MIKKITRKAKRCPYCNSLNTIKKGIRKDIKKPLTRYLCKDCGRKFQEKRRETNLKEKIFKEYFWKKRTLYELTKIFNLNRKVIQKHINDYEVKIKKKKPGKVNLIIDVVFFSKRKFKTEFGVMVFYDSIKQEILIWKEVKNEKLSDYKQMYFQLIRDGFVIQSVVIDGKKGLREFLEKENVIIQYCHFHQLKTILNYITRKPRLQASKHLKLIIEFLTEINEKEFKDLFKDYLINWKDFLNEKQFNLETKRLLRNHNGVSKELKLKMIDEYFENHRSQKKNRKNRV